MVVQLEANGLETRFRILGVGRQSARGGRLCWREPYSWFIANGLVGTSPECPLSLTCSGSGRKISPQRSARQYRTAPLSETWAVVASEFTLVGSTQWQMTIIS